MMSVWFCNILYMVLKFNLTISTIDLDSIEFIRRVLTNQDYHHNAFGVSPNYNNSAIILYHIARLVGSFERPQLEVLKDSLIKALLQERQNSTSFMESLLIRISLLRLGKEPPPLPLPEDWEYGLQEFLFFSGWVANWSPKKQS